jgi:hypothetical protein
MVDTTRRTRMLIVSSTLWSGGLVMGCSSSADTSPESDRTGVVRTALAGSDRLLAGESLYPGQAIQAGGTTLVYQSDNNLVLYQNGGAIWASMCWDGRPCSPTSPNRFSMQTDCNAVVYAASGWTWASWTNSGASDCFAKVQEGEWFICRGTTRLWTARGGGICDGNTGPTGNQGGTKAGYAGCFTDASNRALPYFQGSGFTISACVSRCTGLGRHWAGLQYGGECWCGDVQNYQIASNTECNVPCNAEPDYYCGGVWRNSIYAAAPYPTGSTEPNDPTPECRHFGTICTTTTQCCPGTKCTWNDQLYGATCTFS